MILLRRLKGYFNKCFGNKEKELNAISLFEKRNQEKWDAATKIIQDINLMLDVTPGLMSIEVSKEQFELLEFQFTTNPLYWEKRNSDWVKYPMVAGRRVYVANTCNMLY